MKRFMYLSIGVLCLSLVGITNTHAGTITITCDNHYTLYVDDHYVGSSDGDVWDWTTVETWTVSLPLGPHVIAVHGVNEGDVMGVIAVVETDDGAVYITDSSWRVSGSLFPGWYDYDFDDGGWETALDERAFDAWPWNLFVDPEVVFAVFGQHGARWIWRPGLVWDESHGWWDPNGTHVICYLRKTFMGPVPVENSSWGAIKAKMEEKD